MRWNRVRILAVAASVGLIAAGCSWGQMGGDASRSGYVPLETGITTANVNQLQRTLWSGLDREGAYLANGLLYTMITPSAGGPRILAVRVDAVACQPSCGPFVYKLGGALGTTEFTGAMRFKSPMRTLPEGVTVLAAAIACTTSSGGN